MEDYEDIQLMLECMLLKGFFEHVHHTMGSLSQTIQDDLPSHDFIEAAHRIYPMMITVLAYMFNIVKGMTTHADLDEVESQSKRVEKINVYIKKQSHD